SIGTSGGGGDDRVTRGRGVLGRRRTTGESQTQVPPAPAIDLQYGSRFRRLASSHLVLRRKRDGIASGNSFRVSLALAATGPRPFGDHRRGRCLSVDQSKRCERPALRGT